MRKLTKSGVAGAFMGIMLGGSAQSAPIKPKLSLDQATTIALKKIPGTIKNSELEHEMGQDVYSFDIIGRDKAIHEILINAHSGKIVSNKIESAAQELKEANEEKK